MRAHRFGPLIACLLLMMAASVARAEFVNGVSFQCKAIPQKNIQGAQAASDLQITVINEANAKRMVMRYNVIGVSNAGQQFRPNQMGKQLSPNAKDEHRFSVFGKVGEQDEFPATCQFVNVQVCPVDPPANWAKRPNAPIYYPFLNGPVDGCRRPVNLSVIRLPVPEVSAGCTAFAIAPSDISNHWFGLGGTFSRYYWVHGASSPEAATQNIINQEIDDYGFNPMDRISNPEARPFYEIRPNCKAPRHAAVVGFLKGLPRGTAQGVYLETAIYYGMTKEEAEQAGLSACSQSVSQPSMDRMENRGPCEVRDSW